VNPKPFYRDSVFEAPKLPRLTPAAMRRLEHRLTLLRRNRVMPALRKDMARALFRIVGWEGRTQVSQAEIAEAGAGSISTLGRTLADLTGMGLLRVHHVITRTRGGGVVQDFSVYELIPPPVADRQIGDAELLTEIRGSYYRSRFVQKMKAKSRRNRRDHVKSEREEHEVALVNRQSQLKLLDKDGADAFVARQVEARTRFGWSMIDGRRLDTASDARHSSPSGSG
jgi:hypothetical protein